MTSGLRMPAGDSTITFAPAMKNDSEQEIVAATWNIGSPFVSASVSHSP